MTHKTSDTKKKYFIDIVYERNLSKVHYCADAQDIEFCNKLGLTEMDDFEIAFDTLEKEWHGHLQALIDKLKLIKSTKKCDICSLISTTENPILTCQGCAIPLHRDCYGSCYSDDEFFLCQSCIFWYKDTTCMFCGSHSGALKLAIDNRFGHVLCVLFDSTLEFYNTLAKEPISLENYREIPGKCKFCNKSGKTKIECSYGACMNVYHITCGLLHAYFDTSNEISYCDIHDPTRDKTLFSSSANFKNTFAGYVELKKKPVIRQKVSMYKKIQTNYQKIVSSDPVVFDDTYKTIKNRTQITDQSLTTICKYWVAKKQKYKKGLIGFLRFKYPTNF